MDMNTIDLDKMEEELEKIEKDIEENEKKRKYQRKKQMKFLNYLKRENY